jgi:hypothetical protein
MFARQALLLLEPLRQQDLVLTRQVLYYLSLTPSPFFALVIFQIGPSGVFLFCFFPKTRLGLRSSHRYLPNIWDHRCASPCPALAWVFIRSPQAW